MPKIVFFDHLISCAIRSQIKMAEDINESGLHVDSFAIITSTKETHAMTVRKLLLAHWDKITQQMADCTLLFIGGVHGDEKGQIVGEVNSCKTMANQVSN